MLVGAGCATAEPYSAQIPDGSYGVNGQCSRAAAPDVDMILIRGGSISDIESTCEIRHIREQSDGVVVFEVRCRNDVGPRNSDGFLYRIDKETILLDYGYGPAIWHACTLP